MYLCTVLGVCKLLIISLQVQKSPSTEHMLIDVIFLLIFSYGFWIGYNRGIIGTIFNIGAYVFGIVLAFKITPTTTNILETAFNSDNPTIFLAGFLINLAVIMLVLRMASAGITGLFEIAFLGLFNRAAGGILTGGFFVLIYSVLLWFLVKVQFLNTATLTESKTYPFLANLPSTAKDVAIRFKPVAEDLWGTSLDWMSRLEKFGIEKTGGKSKIYELPDKNTKIEGAPDITTPRTRSNPQEDDDGIE
ncbi:MAG: CvpA family protein [Saprospiraceae bacterium]